MRNLQQLLTLAFLFFSFFTFAQVGTPKAEDPYIEINGYAEKEVIPDEIYIRITIKERDKITVQEQEEKLRAGIKASGIDLTNLVLSDANADYVKVNWVKKDVVTKKDYTLKVTNATAVAQVFQKLDSLQITDAYISKVDHTQIKELKKMVRIEAIKSAKDKADYLLTAIGEQTGKAMVIKENENAPGRNIYAGLEQRSSRSDANEYFVDGIKVRGKSEEFPEIQFQKIKIQSSIYVKFLIN